MATISEALAIAIQHHHAGRLQAAEQIYRQVLAADPNHADAWHLLGVIASQMGKPQAAVEYIVRAIGLKGTAAAFYSDLGNVLRDLGKTDEAVACYRGALELKPDYAMGHCNLGVVLRDQGKLEEAIASYRRALELTPDFAVAYSNLGNALKDHGKLDEAVACYRKALDLKPDYAEAYSNLGAALKEHGKLDEAIACCRRSLELKPDYAEAHNNLGNALKDEEKLEEAVACYHRALELKPDYAEAHSNLGAAFQKQGKLDGAAACCRRSLELKPDYAEAHNNLGNALKELGKLEEALACYRRAVELKPDHAVGRNNLGIALQELGDFQGAENSFRAALRHDCRSAVAHYELAALLGAKLPQDDLLAQRRLLEESDLPRGERLLLHFGLAQVLDARGEYAEAAEHLDRANAMQLSEWRQRGQEYDPQAHELLVTRMIAVCKADFFKRVAGFGLGEVGLDDVGLESEVPVFVVGLPRSGTTLIEQILAAHSQVFAAGEITLARDTLAALGGHYGDSIEALRELDCETARQLALRHLERLRALDRRALRIVDKVPENYLLLGLLAALFPRARFIHCRRDLRDVAVSCWMTHFREVRWANDQRHIGSRFCEYQRIMKHWRHVLPVPVLKVDYEATVADLEGVARRIVAWCGLDWEAGCLEFHQAERPVRTASVVQVRRPVYGTSVRRWKHYEHTLAALLSGLPDPDD